MSADLIVSYDGTSNDEDALALGARLAASGARMALAYVRHAREWNEAREQIAQHDAERLLERGALGLPGSAAVDRHVVIHASTPAGLEQLAAKQGARVIVFGSEYRTSPGRAEPGTSAQQLLDGGPVAVAVAAAGLRVSRTPIATIAVAPSVQDGAAQETARNLASALGVDVIDSGTGADLLVVGSQPGSPAGAISLSGSARAALNAMRGSVLVVPSGMPLALS